MGEQFGIDNLKVAVVAAVNLAEKIEKNYIDDNKISFIEALGIGAGSFTDVLKVIRSGSQIKNEFMDLDSAEKETLMSLIRTELDLENDKVEHIVETALEFLLKLEDLIASIRK